jgi:hypothetical protein
MRGKRSRSVKNAIRKSGGIMTANEQYDIIIFFKSGLPIVISWLFLLILAVIYSALGVVFDSKEKRTGKTIVNISINHSNRYMATMFITVRWIL